LLNKFMDPFTHMIKIRILLLLTTLFLLATVANAAYPTGVNGYDITGTWTGVGVNKGWVVFVVDASNKVVSSNFSIKWNSNNGFNNNYSLWTNLGGNRGISRQYSVSYDAATFTLSGSWSGGTPLDLSAFGCTGVVFGDSGYPQYIYYTFASTQTNLLTYSVTASKLALPYTVTIKANSNVVKTLTVAAGSGTQNDVGAVGGMVDGQQIDWGNSVTGIWSVTPNDPFYNHSTNNSFAATFTPTTTIYKIDVHIRNVGASSTFSLIANGNTVGNLSLPSGTIDSPDTNATYTLSLPSGTVFTTSFTGSKKWAQGPSINAFSASQNWWVVSGYLVDSSTTTSPGGNTSSTTPQVPPEDTPNSSGNWDYLPPGTGNGGSTVQVKPSSGGGATIVGSDYGSTDGFGQASGYIVGGTTNGAVPTTQTGVNPNDIAAGVLAGNLAFDSILPKPPIAAHGLTIGETQADLPNNANNPTGESIADLMPHITFPSFNDVDYDVDLNFKWGGTSHAFKIDWFDWNVPIATMKLILTFFITIGVFWWFIGALRGAGADI